MIISTPTSLGTGPTGLSTGDGTRHGTGTAGMTPIGHGAGADGVRRGVGARAGAGVPHGGRHGVGDPDGALLGEARRGEATARHTGLTSPHTDLEQCVRQLLVAARLL